MITNKIDENTYSVEVYDWIESHDDYICGYIKRDPGPDDESDLQYWLFYPNGGKVPLNARDLKRIEIIMRELNSLN